MKNRILILTRNTIPYVKELHPITGSVVGCLLMQQLDYWFEQYPEGFYKFLEPVEHELYKAGQSWIEELGVSKEEFRTAFDRIGIRYTSKGKYLSTAEKFAGKYYCSYFDNQSHCTHYFRNHEVVDAALDALIYPDESPRKTKGRKSQGRGAADRESQSAADRESQSAADRESQFAADRESQFAADRESQFAADRESHSAADRESQSALYIVSETTLQRKKTTTKKDLPPAENLPLIDLIFPPALFEEEKNAIEKILSGCKDAQAILDEIDGAISNRTVRRDLVVAFCSSLLKAWKEGEFNPALGLAVVRRRQAEKNHADLLGKKPDLDPEYCLKGQAILDRVRQQKAR